MATRPLRRDNTWIWAIGGGGLALAAILLALVLGVVALVWTVRKPATAAPPIANPANPVAAPSTAGRDRLIGTWDATIAGRGSAVMVLRRDGTMDLTATQIGGGQQRTKSGKWEVSGSGDHLRLRRITADSDGTSEIHFTGPDTFTVVGERGSLDFRRRR